jgi:uncharacterized protein YneF (UPF0154 family)
LLPKVSKEMVQAVRREMGVQPESAFFNEVSQALEKNDPILAQFIDLLWMENGASPKLRRGLLGIYQLLASQADADKLHEWFKK